MRSIITRFVALVSLVAGAAYAAPAKINPVTQINWPLVTGSGAPSGGACTTNYGQPYTDTTGPHYYVCTPSGWFQIDGGGGGGGIGGSGTTGFIPKFASSSTIGNSAIDDSITTASTITSSKAFAVNDGSGTAGAVKIKQGTVATNGTTSVSLTVPTSVTSYRIQLPGTAPTSGNTFLSCTAADPAVCTWTAGGSPAFSAITSGTNTTAAMVVGSGASLAPAGTGTIQATNIASTITAGSNVTITGSGTTASPYSIASSGGGGGGGYTNVVGSNAETTVSAINTACSGKTYYATTALSIATGGTITCPVQFSKDGVWTITSGQVVTFSLPVTETDAPAQHFSGAGTVVMAPQDIRPEWWGAVADWNGSTGTDNATAINAAYAALSRGNIRFQAGCYAVGSVITMIKNNTGIVGDVYGIDLATTAGTMKQSCLISTSASADVIDAGNGSSSNPVQAQTFRNLVIARSVMPTGTATGLQLLGSAEATVDHITFEDHIREMYTKNSSSAGNHVSNINLLWNTNGVTYTGSPTVYGVYADSTQFSMVMRHLNAYADSIAGTAIGIYCNNCVDFMVDDFQAFDVATGIYINGGVNAQDLQFSNITIDSVGSYPIFITGLLHNASFNGGWINGNGKYVDIESSSGVIFTGFTFGDVGDATHGALYVHASENSTFSNLAMNLWTTNGPCMVLDGGITNTIAGAVCNAGSAYTGIVLKNTSTYNTLTGNAFVGTFAGGISFDATSSHNNALGNTFLNTVTTPVADSGTGNVWNNQATSNFTVPLANVLAGSSGSGTFDFSGATQIKLPVAASYASAANGEVGYDTTNKNWHLYQNGTDKILAPLQTSFVSGHCGQPTSTSGMWEIQDAGGACGISGGGTAFSAITSGTNTTATMTVGSGATIATSGTGTVNATSIGGITVTGTPSTGYVPTATSSSAATWQPSAGVTTESHTASSSAELDFTTCITGSNRDYEIRVSQLVPATNNVDIVIQFSTNGGSSYDSTSGHYGYMNSSWINGTIVGIGNQSTTQIPLSRGNADLSNTANLGGMSGRYTLFSPGTAGTANIALAGSASTTYTGQTIIGVTATGQYIVHTANVNAFRVLATSGNLTSGTVTCQPLPN